jgi:hypothetical protein
MATPGDRLTYGIIFTNRPVFVAVTLDQDDAKIFRLNTNARGNRFACRACDRRISVVNGTVSHLSPEHPDTPCHNQIKDALPATRLWAPFRTNEEVKASRNQNATFTVEDWNRWLQAAGCHVENLSEHHWQVARRYVSTLYALPAERLRNLRDRINIGENLVRYTNNFPKWSLRSSPLPEKEPTPADNETPTLPRRKKKKSSQEAWKPSESSSLRSSFLLKCYYLSIKSHQSATVESRNSLPGPFNGTIGTSGGGKDRISKCVLPESRIVTNVISDENDVTLFEPGEIGPTES